MIALRRSYDRVREGGPCGGGLVALAPCRRARPGGIGARGAGPDGRHARRPDQVALAAENDPCVRRLARARCDARDARVATRPSKPDRAPPSRAAPHPRRTPPRPPRRPRGLRARGGRSDDPRGAGGLLPLRPQRPRALQRDQGRRDLERGTPRRSGGHRSPRRRAMPCCLPAVGRPPRLGRRSERRHVDGGESRSAWVPRGGRGVIPRERPDASALRHRRPQPVSALSRRAARGHTRRLRRAGRPPTPRGCALPGVRRHRAAAHADLVPRGRIPDRRHAPATRALCGSGERHGSRLGHEPSGATRDSAASRLLPASRRGVLQLPARRRASLGRWQSGLLWANWRRKPKPAFAAFRAAIAEVRAGTVACASPGAIGRPPLSPSPVPERVWR